MSPQPSPVTHRRWWIGVLLGSGILVNYFDRIALSVAAPQLQQEFGLDAAQIGLVFSVFFWSYALSLDPARNIDPLMRPKIGPASPHVSGGASCR